MNFAKKSVRYASPLDEAEFQTSLQIWNRDVTETMLYDSFALSESHLNVAGNWACKGILQIVQLKKSVNCNSAVLRVIFSSFERVSSLGVPATTSLAAAARRTIKWSVSSFWML